jgi:hypothetical protein
MPRQVSVPDSDSQTVDTVSVTESPSKTRWHHRQRTKRALSPSPTSSSGRTESVSPNLSPVKKKTRHVKRVESEEEEEEPVEDEESDRGPTELVRALDVSF